LQARLDDPNKQWKFSVDDLAERKFWDEYMRAYEQALEETSTEWAPWYVVPSNRKWFRDLLVSSVIVKKLKGLNMKYPSLGRDPKSITIP
jgi:polyphosphate kinase 2 (PPK2 family)